MKCAPNNRYAKQWYAGRYARKLQVTRSGYMGNATWSQCCGAVRRGRMVLEAGGKCGQVCTGCDHEPSRTRLGGKSTKVTKKSTPEPSRAIPSQNQPYSVRVIISLEPRTSVTLGRCRCDRSSSASNGTGGIRNGVFSYRLTCSAGWQDLTVRVIFTGAVLSGLVKPFKLYQKGDTFLFDGTFDGMF